MHDETAKFTPECPYTGPIQSGSQFYFRGHSWCITKLGDLLSGLEEIQSQVHDFTLELNAVLC